MLCLGCLVLMFFGACSKVMDDVEDLLTDNVWKDRAEQITEGCITHYDKAKAIYEWECANIAYDLDYSINTAQGCWDERKGICQAYSRLFVKLASRCDLQAEVVSGNCRTLFHMDGEGDHAWVKVNTEKGWILIDPTWGAGYVSMDQEEFCFYDHNMSWFEADPEVMVFTHFPHSQSDQLLDHPLTKEQYQQLPLVEPEVVHAGWNGHEVLNYFLNHPGESAPTFYLGFIECLGKFEMVQMPYNGTMKVGETYTLKIKSLDLNEISWVSINGQQWQQEGDVFTCVFVPEYEGSATVYLGGRGVMSYEVTN